MVVATPVDDAFLDGFGLQVLGEGFAEEGGQLVIRGEAESDELLDREIVDVRALFGGKECVEAETLFEANDAVLNSESLRAGDAGQHEKKDGHGDPPKMSVLVTGPVVHGGVDREDEVEQEQGQDEEVKERIETRVVLVGLWSGHWSPLGAGCDGGPQHSTLWVRLEG